MRSFRSLSLRHLLTVPYVALVLLLALLIGWLSYRSGRQAVDTLSGRLLDETVARIGQAVEKHIYGSAAVLEVAFPRGLTAPADLAADQEALRLRFWQATSVHRALNNYAYYGDEQGRFFGLWRDSETDAQLRLRTKGEGPRTLYGLHGLRGQLVGATLEDRVFEPRERPWYRSGLTSREGRWTPIYVDFRSSELVATRARMVPRADGSAGGVVATDVSLRALSDFVRQLPLTAHGLAYVVEPDGNLIATSRGAFLHREADGRNERLNAAQSEDALLAASYAAVKVHMAQAADTATMRSETLTGPDGGMVQLAWTRMRDGAGLDWIIAVAVPRADFLQGITDNVYETLILGVLAALAAALLGWVILGVMARDLRQLSVAARRVGEGDFNAPLGIQRGGEIGDLARSFHAMTRRLSTDRLTGQANREAFLRRLHERIARQRRSGDAGFFAVLSVDVDQFKTINARHGHDAGDRVLIELGHRLQGQVREGDLVARWRGDEFVILLDDVASPEVARQVADKLRAAVERDIVIQAPSRSVDVVLSIGAALFPQDGTDADALLRQAESRRDHGPAEGQG